MISITYVDFENLEQFTYIPLVLADMAMVDQGAPSIAAIGTPQRDAGSSSNWRTKGQRLGKSRG